MKEWFDPGVGRSAFKNSATSVLCPLSWPRRKANFAKGESISSDLEILYPAPKISNLNLNFKLRWRKILLLAPLNYFLLVPTWIFLGIGDSQRFLWGIPICFPCCYLLDFSLLGELHQPPKWQDLLHAPRPIFWLRMYIRLNNRNPWWLENAT